MIKDADDIMKFIQATLVAIYLSANNISLDNYDSHIDAIAEHYRAISKCLAVIIRYYRVLSNDQD